MADPFAALLELAPAETPPEQLLLDDSGTPPDNDPADTPEVADGPRCEADGCGVEIPWSGRGRKPKRCVDHKTRTAGKTSRSRRGGVPARQSQLQEEIQSRMVELGVGLSLALPVSGVLTCQRAPGVSTALAQIAMDHPAMMAMMTSTLTTLRYFSLGHFAAEFGIAVAVDLGRMDPNSVPARMTGVGSIYDQVHPEGTEATQVDNEPVSPFTVAVPNRFNRIA